MNNLNILYEDNHIIVVEKPVNILSQADITKDIDLLTMVKSYIKEKYQKPGNVYVGLVHRLDRPVGGIMVFAKTSKAAKRLNEQIKNNQMQKTYYAVIEGLIKPSKGMLIDKIEKKPNQEVLLNTINGKDAKLEYEVLETKDNLSLVKINLITGRYHQIRLQFSSRNYPLYGDKLYGSKYNEQIALFAYQITFYHPTTKELMTFSLNPTGNIWQKFDLLCVK